MDERHVAGGALDDRADRGALASADDEVSFPVAGDGAFFDLGRPVADHDHSVAVAGLTLLRLSARFAACLAGAQCVLGRIARWHGHRRPLQRRERLESDRSRLQRIAEIRHARISTLGISACMRLLAINADELARARPRRTTEIRNIAKRMGVGVGVGVKIVRKDGFDLPPRN